MLQLAEMEHIKRSSAPIDGVLDRGGLAFLLLQLSTLQVGLKSCVSNRYRQLAHHNKNVIGRYTLLQLRMRLLLLLCMLDQWENCLPNQILVPCICALPCIYVI